jgi:hypothetical protein
MKPLTCLAFALALTSCAAMRDLGQYAWCQGPHDTPECHRNFARIHDEYSARWRAEQDGRAFARGYWTERRQLRRHP